MNEAYCHKCKTDHTTLGCPPEPGDSITATGEQNESCGCPLVVGGATVHSFECPKWGDLRKMIEDATTMKPIECKCGVVTGGAVIHQPGCPQFTDGPRG